MDDNRRRGLRELIDAMDRNIQNNRANEILERFRGNGRKRGAWFKKHAERFGLKPDDFGKKYVGNDGLTYKIVGIIVKTEPKKLWVVGGLRGGHFTVELTEGIGAAISNSVQQYATIAHMGIPWAEWEHGNRRRRRSL